MSDAHDDRTLRTQTGDLPLAEYRLRLGGHEWSILHTHAIIGMMEEQRFLSEDRAKVPYGVALWASSIALAHDLVARGDALRGRRVLELGAGTGLAGIVAATLGARVVQTDRQALALSVCERNGARNHVHGVEHRLADWTLWDDTTRYDAIIGADVIYSEAMHPHLRHILDTNVAPGAPVLLADPMRKTSMPILEALEGDGWTVRMARWSIGEGTDRRTIGVYELHAPA